MNNKLPLLCCFMYVLAMLPFVAVAQTETGFGIRAGINIADNQRKGDDIDESYGNRIAPVAGIFVIIPISSNFALQPEVWYMQKGVSPAAPC